MPDKVMRGWVHVAAIVLGVGVPAGLTMGTLRTGADYEVVATPKQVVEGLEKALAEKGQDAVLDGFVAPDVVTHRSVMREGAASFAEAARADAERTQDLPARSLSANASLVMVQSAMAGAEAAGAPVVQIYRVRGGRIVEYWSAQPAQ